MSRKCSGGVRLTKYECGLTGEGVSLYEMLKLIELSKDAGDYRKLRMKVFAENYLGKNSDSRIDNILRAFKKRFLNDADKGLPPVKVLSLAIDSDLPEESKRQILFPYYLFSDDLLRTTYDELVIKSMEKGERLTINNADVVDFLKELGKGHKNIAAWSENSKKKWATRFLTFLRTFGMLEKYPANKLKKMYVLPETFAFFALWLADNGLPFQRIMAYILWRFYLMSVEEVLERTYYGNKKDWWYFEETAGIITFQPRYNLGGWLEHGLE